MPRKALKQKSNGKGNGAGKVNKPKVPSFAAFSLRDSANRKVSPAAAGFVERIKSTWQKAVASIIDTGRILIEAKEGPNKLDHGQFLNMIGQQLPFGSRTAQMLMRIARNPVLSNAKFVSHLPPSWGTLYPLTMISDKGLVQYIERGQVNAGTTLAAVKRLGVRPFAELPRALRLFLSFMGKFPDPDEIAEELVEHGGFDWTDGFHLYDAMTKLPGWIEKLLVAAKRKSDAMDAALHPDQKPERAKVYNDSGVRFADDVQHTD